LIPLRDENPTRTVPYVVYALVILNIIVFVYNGTLEHGARNPLAGFELVPAELTTGRDVGPTTQIPIWLTIFSSMFLHANLLHIGGNMLYLWIFGNNVEDTLGHFRFLAFYLIAGVAAAMAQVAMGPDSTTPMVGASGAIAGVLGAYLVLFPRARVISVVFLFFFIQMIALPAYVVLGMWIVLQIINGLVFSSGMTPGGGIAYGAHVGGFLAGTIMIYIFGGKSLTGNRRSREW
jgi:membrane associated rhomboid family serine protease